MLGLLGTMPSCPIYLPTALYQPGILERTELGQSTLHLKMVTAEARAQR